MLDCMTQKGFLPSVLATIFLMACSTTVSFAQDSIFTGKPKVPLATTIEKNLVDSPDDSSLSSMDLRARIAQLMVITLSGTHGLSSEDRAFLKIYPPGAVIIHQLPRPSFAPEYLAEIRKYEQVNRVPLLVGCDLYQLTKQQFKRSEGFSPLPSMLSIAAAGDETAARRLGQILARHMNAMGFDFYLGPSLAQASTLSTAPGTIHNFGNHPAFTTSAGWSLISAFRDNGVIVIPTGFPGGGENRLPGQTAVLLTPQNQLRKKDLAPYIKVIKEGIDFLHVGNVLTPMLDSQKNPASVSYAILQTLLRDELGYNGITLVGPVDHPDIQRRLSPGDAAVMALNNGADMIYWGKADNMTRAGIETIIGAVQSGRLPESIIDAAFERILDHKLRLVPQPRILPKTKVAAKLEGDKKLIEESYQLERRAITLVQNRGQVLPLTKTASVPIGITGVIGVELLHDALEKHLKPIAQQPITTARHLGEIQDFEIDRVVSRAQGIRTAIIVLGEKLRHNGQTRLIRALKKKGARVVVVLLGYPEMLPKVSEADAILLAYTDNNAPEAVLRAIAEIIVGLGPIQVLASTQDFTTKAGELRTFDAAEVVQTPTGRLPITISESYGSGLSLGYAPHLAMKKISWDFGNGMKSKDVSSEIAFTEPGRHQVTLTVTDNNNQVTSGTFNILVLE